MPRGPFSPVEQQPVSDLRLRQTRLPVNPAETTGTLIQQTAQSVTPLIEENTERFKDKLETNLEQELDAVQLGLAAFRDPTVQQNIFSAAAEGNPFFRRAKEEFLSIADAVQQGKLPGDAATIRTEAALKAATARNPEFTDELRAAAQQALGFSPEAQVFRNLLREPTAADKTPQQKAEEEIQKQMVLTGLPRDVIIAGNQSQFVNKIELDRLSLALREGEVGANQVAAIADKNAANMMLTVVAGIQTQVQQGGIYEPQQAKAAAQAAIAAQRAEALAALPPTAGIDARNRISNQFNDHARVVNQMIDDGTMEQIVTQHNKTLQALTINNVMKDPLLGTVYSIAGSEGVTTMLSAFGRYPTQRAFEIAMQVDPELAGYASLEQFAPDFAREIQLQGQGVPPTSRRASILRGMYNVEVIKDGNQTEDNKVNSLEAMRRDLGDASTFRQFEDGKMLAQTKQSAGMREGFANLFAQQYAANVSTLQGALNDAALPADVGVELVDGQLRLTGVSSQFVSSSSGQFGSPTGISAGLRRSVDKTNTLLRIGKMYSGAGVIEWEGADKFFADVLGAEVEAPQPTARRMRYDPESGQFSEVE